MKKNLQNDFRPLLTILLLFYAATAFAHAETGVAGGLVSGLLHPILGFDHLVAMVAVGLWGAQLGKPAIWLLPITFPVVMAIGALAGVAGLPLPFVEVAGKTGRLQRSPSDFGYIYVQSLPVCCPSAW